MANSFEVVWASFNVFETILMNHIEDEKEKLCEIVQP